MVFAMREQVGTACGHWIAHRIWKEIKQQPGTAGPGNMLGWCLVSFHFLWVILCPQAVHGLCGIKYGSMSCVGLTASCAGFFLFSLNRCVTYISVPNCLPCGSRVIHPHRTCNASQIFEQTYLHSSSSSRRCDHCACLAQGEI